MYILKNAFKSISRSKGRNILVGIIVVLIAVASCIALAINNSANEIVKAQRESGEIIATLTRAPVQRQTREEGQTGGGMTNIFANMQELTIDEITLYGSSEYVKSYYYSMAGTINSTNIEAFTTESSTDSEDSQQQNPGGQRPGGATTLPGIIRVGGDLSITGYSSAMTEFLNGSNRIIDGTMFDDGTSENLCIISEDLAIYNDLQVGDTITFANPQDEEETYDFKIAGIYEIKDLDLSMEQLYQRNTAANPVNKIITSYKAFDNMVKASAQAAEEKEAEEATTENAFFSTAMTGQLSTSFVLAESGIAEAFHEDLKSKGLSEFYTVSSNEESIEKSLVSINNLSDFSGTFLLIVVIVGGIILVVINMINIRERKYEVGVLTAIGMKKTKVALQFVTELFIVTFIALIIGSSVGAVLSVPVASSMLESEIAAQESVTEERQNNFGGTRPGQGQTGGFREQGGIQIQGGMGGMGGMGNWISGNIFNNEEIDYVDQINAVIDAKVLLELFGIGLVLTMISSGVAIIFISRYSPLKILSERA